MLAEIIIASCLMAEAEGEGVQGINGVADTIANRAERRGIAAVAVVQQRGQYASLTTRQREVRARRSPAVWAYCLEVGGKLARGEWIACSGWTHFYAPAACATPPPWAKQLTMKTKLGKHVFGRLP